MVQYIDRCIALVNIRSSESGCSLFEANIVTRMLSVRTRLCPSLSYAQTFVLIADAPGSSTQHIAAAAQVPQNRSRK